MKKTLMLMLMAVLLLPLHAAAFDLGSIFGGGDDDAAGSADAAKPKGNTRYIIHFKSGGSIEADNYTIGKTYIEVMMPSGGMYFEKAMITSIEEVQGAEAETVQSIEVQPAKPAPKPDAKEPAKAANKPAKLAPQGEIEPTDDEGHNESWWRERVGKLREKRADAEARYNQAKNDWNKYNGIVNQVLLEKGASVEGGAVPGSPEDKKVVVGSNFTEYDVTNYQDLRGSARVEMDRAKAEMDEIDHTLNVVIPDEARKAGAPPGWLR